MTKAERLAAEIWLLAEDGTLTPHTRLAQIRRVVAELRALLKAAK